MATGALKLKQASAVLKIQPKELQNLVQFGVLKPERGEGTYLFDTKALLSAKVAFCLKESLGTRANVLTNVAYCAEYTSALATLIFAADTARRRSAAPAVSTLTQARQDMERACS